MKCPNCSEELSKSPGMKDVWECTSCGVKIKFIDDCSEEQESDPDPASSGTVDGADGNEHTDIQAAKGNRNKQPLFIGIAIVVVVIIICFFALSGNKKDFNKLYSDIAEEDWCTISEDGSYMKIDTNPYDIDDYNDIDAYNEIEVINEDLEFSAALFEKMGETTALDGRQTEETDQVTVSWKYHPDNGLEVTYEWN